METDEKGARHGRAIPDVGVSRDDEVVAHLRALDAISRSELPDGSTRTALIQAIQEGAISGVFPSRDAQSSLFILAWARPTPAVSAYRTLAQVNAVWALIARWRVSVRNAHALWLLFLDGHAPEIYFDGTAGVWRTKAVMAARSE